VTVSGRIAAASYLSVLLLQPAWHALLPAPHGAGSLLLATAATIPLLIPLKGVLRGSLRSLTWAGYLLMLYLVIGVTEAWSNPPQRIPALLQSLFVVVYVGSVLVFSRRSSRG
jgi:uncharacterized membrane protein